MSNRVNPNKHYVTNFNVFETFSDVTNVLENFTFIETRILEVTGGCRKTR